jgi:isopenicillin-N epimerase
MSLGSNPIWGDDWEEIRRLWPLDPAVAHCNHGSFGAVPSPVLAVQDQFRQRMVANPVRWFHSDTPELVVGARGEIARFFGADPADLALIINVSAGVSVLAQSLPLEPGDEVLSSSHIYGWVSVGLDRLCARTGAIRVVAEIPADAPDDEVVAAFARRCSERTRFVVVDQVTSPTARRFPIEAVVGLAHAAGAAVLIDGAHAPGMLQVDIPSIGADFWVGNLHKWPCAPAGTGVMWVTPAWQDRMLALVVSVNEAEGFPSSFDRVGTQDLSAWLAAPSALELLGSLGWERVRKHNEELVVWAQAAVAETLGIPESELHHDPGVSMAVVPLPAGLADTRKETSALGEHMARQGVEMAVGAWGGRGAIRLSAHLYNQPADYQRLALGVRDYLAG